MFDSGTCMDSTSSCEPYYTFIRTFFRTCKYLASVINILWSRHLSMVTSSMYFYSLKATSIAQQYFFKDGRNNYMNDTK